MSLTRPTIAGAAARAACLAALAAAAAGAGLPGGAAASGARQRRHADHASVMCSAPPLNVTFPGDEADGRSWPVSCGQKLAKQFSAVAPSVRLPGADLGSVYALVMLDRDAPSHEHPVSAPYLHWIVGNVPGEFLAGVGDGRGGKAAPGENIVGDVVASYLPPSPPPGTGFHRYALFLFRQSDQHIQYRLQHGPRARFNITAWAWDHDLGRPVASNFFRTRDAPEEMGALLGRPSGGGPPL